MVLTAGQDLDPPVGQIAGMTVQPESLGLGASGCAKRNALHPAADPHAPALQGLVPRGDADSSIIVVVMVPTPRTVVAVPGGGCHRDHEAAAEAEKQRDAEQCSGSAAQASRRVHRPISRSMVPSAGSARHAALSRRSRDWPAPWRARGAVSPRASAPGRRVEGASRVFMADSRGLQGSQHRHALLSSTRHVTESVTVGASALPQYVSTAPIHASPLHQWTAFLIRGPSFLKRTISCAFAGLTPR